MNGKQNMELLLPKAVLTPAASPHIFESPAMEGRYDIKPSLVFA